ncbi:MAG: UDP-N-acetylglucosamine 2-epimerase (non-hydrolyzing) [Chloroflexota bacterium]
MKILIVYGTRPEAIKLAPVIQELKKYPEVETVICVTAQHRSMLDQVNQLFGIETDFDLDLMQPNQTLAELSGRVLSKVSPVIEAEKPDWVIVQGDTTTVALTALAAYYQGVRVAHVEAGLRTGNKRQPFPEEINRKITGVLADLHFAPTESARQNLLNEGVESKMIEVTGNTIVDSLQIMVKLPLPVEPEFLVNLPDDREVVLLTAHRRENFGEPLENIFTAVKILADKYADQIQIVYPVHLNPHVQEPANRILGDVKNISLIAPIDYHSFVLLLKRCKFVMTDSGGIQEEAPSFGKPVLVLRDTTERPEGIEAGIARLVGPADRDSIVEQASILIENSEEYHQMSSGKNPYGDGNAAERIAQLLIGD